MLMRMGAEPGTAFSTTQLADEFQLSRHHLTKIMQRLAKAGIVETRRGGGGGATLIKQPEDIRLGDVVQLLEQDQALVECLSEDGNECVIDGRCLLKGRLRNAERVFLEDLNRSTLADVLLKPSIVF